MNIWFTDRFLSSMMNFGEIIDDPLSDEALRELTEAEIAIINALKCFAKEEYITCRKHLDIAAVSDVPQIQTIVKVLRERALAME